MSGKQLFDGTRLNAFAVDPESLVLVEDPAHLLFDERVGDGLDEAFIRNIKTHGVLEPVLVRKNAEGQPEVIDGRQRVKAAREANKRLAAEGEPPLLVPIIASRGSDQQLSDAVIATNEARRNDSAIVRAKKIQRFIGSGRTEDQASEVFCCPLSAIKQSLKLLEARPDLRAAVESGKLSVSAAVRADRLPDDEVEKLLKSDASTVADVAKAERESKGESKIPTRKELNGLLEVEMSKDAKAMLVFVLTGKITGCMKGVA
jgi:ParB family transcriptional regulator, chromosome partitioning protein